MLPRWALFASAAMAVLLLAPVGAGAPADRDGDSIPDAVEQRLGTDPLRPERLQLVVDDKPRGAGDRTYSRGLKEANDIDKVFVASAGGNRILIVVQFTAPVKVERRVLHVYVDWDMDRTNGRQDADWVRGVDVMYSGVNGDFGPRVFTPQVRESVELPARFLVDGNRLYVCDDVRPKMEGGVAHFRLHVLSHMEDNSADGDYTGFFDVALKLADAPEAPLPFPVRKGFYGLPGDWELIGAIRHAADTIELDLSRARSEGFELWHDGSLHAPAGRRAKAIIKSPASGRFYIAIAYFSPRATVGGCSVKVSGRQVGVAACAMADLRRVVVCSEQPVRVRKGVPIELEVAEGSGPVVVRWVWLLRRRVQMPPLRIENIEVWHMPDEPGMPRGRVMVAWTTNRPAECTVRFALAGPEAYEHSGTIDERRGAVNNHFIILEPSEFRGSRYSLRIAAREPAVPPYWPGSTAQSKPFVVVMHPPRPGRERPGRVGLNVAEPLGRARLWPVRSGVPIPKGALWDAGRCRLLDERGQPVPAQFCAWSRWPDGSIKWLVVDFVDRTAPQGRKYVLQYDTGPAPAEPALEARRGTGGELLVEGRRLRAAFSAGHLLGPCYGDVDGDGKAADDELVLRAADLILTDTRGRSYTSARPDEALVEEIGPVRAIVRRSGYFVDEAGNRWLHYTARVHIFHDLPWMWLELSLDVGPGARSDMERIGSLLLRVEPAADSDAAWMGEGRVRPVSRPVRVVQDYENRFLLDGRPAGEHHCGAAALLRGGRPLLLAAVRDFWKLWPKGFSASRQGLDVELLPALPAGQYTSEEDRKLVDRLFFFHHQGAYLLRRGVRVTTELALNLAPPRRALEMQAFARAASAPLFAAAPPEWYCSSGAFGDIYPASAGAFPRYEENIDWSFKAMAERQARQREFGFINYGDWWGERRWNWGNCEYDTQWCLALLFAHTGRLDFLWRGEAAERHKSDIDVIHWHPDPRWIGREWAHSLGHTGGYFPPSWKNMGAFARGAWNYGHMWCQGHFAYAALMGSRRFLEAARLVADQFATWPTTNFDFGAERYAGWPLTAAVSAYLATGNPFYLNAARIFAERTLQKQDPKRGLWGHWAYECEHKPKHWGGKPFMAGILLTGLRMHHQVEPRKDVARAIVKGADWLWNEAWVEKDLGFWYVQCPTYMKKGNTWTMCLLCDGLAYAAVLDRDYWHRRRDVMIRALAAHLYRSGRSSFGKSFSQETCSMLYGLSWLRKLGVARVSEAMSRPPKLDVRSVLVLQPGEKRSVMIGISVPAPGQVKCRLQARAPRWLRVKLPARIVLREGRGWAEAVVEARGAGEGEVRWVCSGPGASVEASTRASVCRPMKLGSEVGAITDGDDYFVRALSQAGLNMRRLEKVTEAELARCGAVVVGREAMLRDWAGVRSAAAELARFVISGGLVVCGQLNDEKWDPGFLPLDIFLDEAETAAGRIVVPGHPIFAGLGSADALAGVVSFDHISRIGSGWDILAVDAQCRPAVLEGRVGSGRVLVIEPSFDRVAVGALEAKAETRAACQRLMRNVAAYIRQWVARMGR